MVTWGPMGETLRVSLNIMDGMFGNILLARMKLTYQCAITGVKSHGQKERRIIETLEPVLRSHKLVIDQSALERDSGLEDKQYSLGHQLTRVTYDRGSLKWDDRLDCIAMGVSHVNQVAGVNSKEATLLAERIQKENAIEDMLKNSRVFTLHTGQPVDMKAHRKRLFLKRRT